MRLRRRHDAYVGAVAVALYGDLLAFCSAMMNWSAFSVGLTCCFFHTLKLPEEPLLTHPRSRQLVIAQLAVSASSATVSVASTFQYRVKRAARVNCVGVVGNVWILPLYKHHNIHWVVACMHAYESYLHFMSPSLRYVLWPSATHSLRAGKNLNEVPTPMALD